MICPKCNIPNKEEHAFCVECGTVLPKITEISSETPTIFYQTEEELKTVYIPSDKPSSETQEPAPTLFYSPENTGKNEVLPTELYTPQDLQPTQHYSTGNTSQEKVSATEVIPTEVSSPKIETPKPQSETNQFVPPQSVETVVKSNFELPKEETIEETKKPKKKLWKFVLVGGIFIVLLLLGGGTAAYFLANPMQENKSYILTDKHDGQENTLTFDNQNKVFLTIATDNSSSQKWQITPNFNDKNYYRFVNRNLGEKQSLEVVNDDFDSSIGMAQSAKDVGQLWAITNVKDDYYRITNQWLGDSKSLSHSKQYYFFLRVRDSNSSDGQLWKKSPAPNGQGFYLTNKKYGDTVFLQALNKDEFKDKLVMKSGEYGNRQWNLNDIGNGFYNLTTVGEGKSLEINQSKTDRIKMSALASSAEQRWKMIPESGDYFRLTNESLGDGKSLEAITFSKYQVGMVKSSDSDLGQLWKLSRVQ